MGYSTTYSLDIQFPKNLTDVEKHNLELDIIEKLENSDDLGFGYVLIGIYESSQLWKWYECETEMKEFSKLFKYVIFIIKGEGEQNDEIWYRYFKNGKMKK